MTNKTNQQKVAEFMRLAQQEVRERPGLPKTHVQILRIALIKEELDELREAENVEEAADAIGDLLYVVYGAACAYGIPAQAIFDEVHRSNMSKFHDGKCREDGKWIRGPKYTPPNIKRVLETSTY